MHTNRDPIWTTLVWPARPNFWSPLIVVTSLPPKEKLGLSGKTRTTRTFKTNIYIHNHAVHTVNEIHDSIHLTFVWHHPSRSPLPYPQGQGVYRIVVTWRCFTRLKPTEGTNTLSNSLTGTTVQCCQKPHPASLYRQRLLNQFSPVRTRVLSYVLLTCTNMHPYYGWTLVL